MTTHLPHGRRARLGTLGLLTALLLGAIVFAPSPLRAAGVPSPPSGLTAIALDGQVGLAWKPATGATSYQLYRGTSAGSITTLVTTAGYTGTTFTDTGRTNGTTYYYAVKATSSDGQSAAGQLAQAKPAARSCSTGNAVRIENCFPGTAAWKSSPGATSQDSGGIEGYLSAASVDNGSSVDLHVSTANNAPYHVEIYRTGSYAGTQGRLIGQIPGRVGGIGFCAKELNTTGLIDCADWDSDTTITTTAQWVSGVYLIKLVRDDNNTYNEIPLVVREDGSTSDVLFGVPTNTYHAYNGFLGKSLYDWNSDAPNTVAGTTRAVQVSMDRPFSQPSSGAYAHDYYTRTDIATVSWLEKQGYNTTYVASPDLEANGAQLTSHDVYISGSHDEYWSQNEFDAVVAARNAGTSLIFMGANAAYWKVRFAASPVSGAANRVIVAYKTVQSGPADPTGAKTSTWRDPAGPNRPENQLIGQMYIGDNDVQSFPLQVSGTEGKNRVWRYTSAADQAVGAEMSIGSEIVGWEWDARVANGLEPAGTTTVASSPVTGNLVQNSGAVYTTGSATQSSTIYKAASGATVFSTGTNNWWRGLGLNVHGAGEPDTRLQQVLVNVLNDTGSVPSTLASGLTVDPAGAPAVSSSSPAAGATNVSTTAKVSFTFDKEIDTATVANGDITLTGPGGAVAGTVALDNATKTLTFTPSSSLNANAGYTATLVAGSVKAWNGTALGAAVARSFSTGAGAPPTVIGRTPGVGTTGNSTINPVKATFDRTMNAATITTSTAKITGPGGSAVNATVAYDAATKVVSINPTAALAESTTYTATLTTGIAASDGIALGSDVQWTFTTGTNVDVSSRVPANGATNVSPAAVISVVFSRAVDAATVTTSSLSVDKAGVPVAGSVSYDPVTRTATFSPSADLAGSSTFNLNVTSAIRDADNAPVDGGTTTFTTAAVSSAPTVTATAPLNGATSVPTSTNATATFDRALNAATVTAANVKLTPDGGSAVAATISYDATARRITLDPLADLTDGGHYTLTLTTGIQSSTGTPLATQVTSGFTVSTCPCSLMGTLGPAVTGLPVQDGRGGSGPWTYEMGTKITVTKDSDLTSLRFYKDPAETGTHVGRVWTEGGTPIANVTFTGETASGWQKQTLSTPIGLSTGTNYVVSVNLNNTFVFTQSGLASPIVSGPLKSVGPGLYGGSAGTFPTGSWNDSNYFVDGVVAASSAPAAPAVITQSPSSGATGVATSTTVRADFSKAMDATTLTTATVKLNVAGGGAAVTGTVGYDAVNRRATFTPSAPLAEGTAYTATITTGAKASDGTPLASQVTWTFSTQLPSGPAVTATSPANGATGFSPSGAITATFSAAMDASTITAANVQLLTPASAVVPATVAYNATTRVATLTPSSPLATSTTYTARVTTGVKDSSGTAMGAQYSWTLTTSQCPCSLLSSWTPSATGLDVQDGRGGAGPFSYEMGFKIRSTQNMSITAIKFYKSAGETGTHTGRIWSSSGTQVASVTFGTETASGWQTGTLTTPYVITANQTYTVSVGFNKYFVMQAGTFTNTVSNGPLAAIADGANGVFGASAGTFPTGSWNNSSYGVDVIAE
jgi:Domain of unknown function (DUF4082)/Bacterial Ig-like domain